MPKKKVLMVSLEEDEAKKLAEVISNETSRKIMNFLSGRKDATETQISKSLKIPLSTVHYNLKKLEQAQLVHAETFHYSKKGREVDHYKLANKYVVITTSAMRGLKTQLSSLLPVGLVVLGFSWLIYFVKSFSSRMPAAPIPAAEFDEAIVASAPPAQAKVAGMMESAQDSVATAASSGIEAYGNVVDRASDAVASSIPSSVSTATAQPAIASGEVQIVAEEPARMIIDESAITIPSNLPEPGAIAEPNVALWFLLGATFAVSLYIIVERIRRKQ